MDTVSPSIVYTYRPIVKPRNANNRLLRQSFCRTKTVVKNSTNTCNLSEDWVGYSTRYGDAAGDFSPLGGLTVAEVIAVGKEIGLPVDLVEKTPSDGLCGKTDEDNLGFTYAVLDKYIRTGICEDPATKALIDRKHELNLFKLKPIPHFEP